MLVRMGLPAHYTFLRINFRLCTRVSDHHAEAATLPPPDVDALLDKAEKRVAAIS